MFEIDTGSSGSGSSAPWLNWHSQESKCGSYKRCSWSIRDSEGKKPFSAFENGLIWDIDNLQTGWGMSTGQQGVPPEYQWNPSVSQFMPQPSPINNNKWSRALRIPMASVKGNTVTWEQASAGAWTGLEDLIPALRQREGSKLPLVKFTGFKTIQAKNAYNAPVFEVVEWVDRPAALQADIATEPTAAPAEEAPAKEAPAAQPETVDDNEF